ncbi:MAG: fibronectin type III domain-containing protein, partial [Longimicrobiaceae bacterium]
SVYVDGAPVPVTASGTAATPANVTNSLRLLAGATDQVQEPYIRFTGELDELRVWSVARTAQQIAASWNLPLQLPQPGLVGYWTFDAASFADSSPTGNAFAPQGAATLVTPGAPLSSTPLAAPTLQQTAYDGAQVSAQWTAVADSRVTGYTLAVFVDGTQVGSTQVAAGQTRGSVVAQLDPSRACTARVQAVAGSVVSGWSTAMPVIAAAPAIASVSCDGTTVGVTWSAVGGATGYMLAAYDGTTVVGSANVAGTQGSVTVQLDPAKTYTVRVRATSGASTGPGSAAVPVVFMAPAIASVAYDGTNVGAAWSAVTGAAGYALTVYDGTTAVGTASTTATHGTVAAQLDPTKVYTVRVRATNGVSSGPESAAVTVIVAAPTIASVAYDGANVSAAWSAVTGAAGYALTVYDGTTAVGTASTTGTQGSVAATLDPARSYTVRVRATGEHSGGPESAAITVLTVAPTGMQLDYDGAALVASWQAVANAPGYSAELQADGTAVETQPATGTTATFTRALASGVVYTARVRVSAPPALGPWSATAAGPYLAAVSYVYDPLGRLTSVAMPTVTLGYTYDDAGNVLTATRTLRRGGNAPAGQTLDGPTP